MSIKSLKCANIAALHNLLENRVSQKFSPVLSMTPGSVQCCTSLQQDLHPVPRRNYIIKFADDTYLAVLTSNASSQVATGQNHARWTMDADHIMRKNACKSKGVCAKVFAANHGSFKGALTANARRCRSTTHWRLSTMSSVCCRLLLRHFCTDAAWRLSGNAIVTIVAKMTFFVFCFLYFAFLSFLHVFVILETLLM